MVYDNITVLDLLCDRRQRLIEIVQDPTRILGAEFMTNWGRVSLLADTCPEHDEDRIDYTEGHTFGMPILIEMIQSSFKVKDRPSLKISTRQPVFMICGADELLTVPEKRVIVVNVNDDRWDVVNEREPRQMLENFYHGTRHVFMGALIIDLLSSKENLDVEETERINRRLWDIFRNLGPNYAENIKSKASRFLNNPRQDMKVSEVIYMGTELFKLEIDGSTAVREALHMLCSKGIQVTVRRKRTVTLNYFDVVSPRHENTLPGKLVVDACIPIMGIGHDQANKGLVYTRDGRKVRVEYDGSRAVMTVLREGRWSWLRTLCRQVYC